MTARTSSGVLPRAHSSTSLPNRYAGAGVGGEVGAGVCVPGGVEEAVEVGFGAVTVGLQFGDFGENQLRQIPYALEHLDLATFGEVLLVRQPLHELSERLVSDRLQEHRVRFPARVRQKKAQRVQVVWLQAPLRRQPGLAEVRLGLGVLRLLAGEPAYPT